ncbi:hypothetical protein Tco_0139403 [Tanacetum coccineum]
MRLLAMYVPEPGRGSSIPIDLFTAFALTSQNKSGLSHDEHFEVDDLDLNLDLNLNLNARRESQCSGSTSPSEVVGIGPSGSSGPVTRSKKRNSVVSMSKAFRAKAKAEKEIVGVSENICLFRSIERRVYGLQKRCIDGAFMKRLFPCQVLAVVGLDPNNENYPLAYTLVEAESRAITDLLLNNNCEVFNSKIVGARDKATTTLL